MSTPTETEAVPHEVPPERSEMGSIKVPWAVVLAFAGLAVGGGGATAIQRATESGVSRADVVAIERRVSQHDVTLATIAEQLRQLRETAERIDRRLAADYEDPRRARP